MPETLPVDVQELRNRCERELEWLSEYTGWLKGIFDDPPKPVSHPQHADIVKMWIAERARAADLEAALRECAPE